jgi:UPF0271 protein
MMKIPGGAAGPGSKEEQSGECPPAIDLNCDMGEGMDTDAAIFPFISSANIACGAHAGDEDTMRRTVAFALQNGVAIGAHPSYPDRERFGRVDMLGAGLSLGDLAPLLREQLWQLQAICDAAGTRLRHIKPHGALYNRAARDAAVATMIVRVVAEFDPSLLFYGLSGSEMRRAADAGGLRFVSEVFADRTYQPDGSLTPRTEPDALIDDPARSLEQVLQMVTQASVHTAAGPVPITAETICLHGDGAHAVEFAGLIHDALSEKGVRIAAPGRSL